MNLINKDGSSFFVPVTEKATPTINSFRKWEQAFEVYTTIYSDEHPGRAGELFRHIFNIRSVSETFIWDHVYNYDIMFRELMSHYPQCDWGGGG